MHGLSTAVSVLAAGALAAGSIGMAQAAPHTLDEHVHGLIGEDTTLARSGDVLAARTKLRGKVNDNRVITLSDTSLSPGRYRIIIRDSTKRHNWHVFGNGLDKSTTVRGKGRWSWKVRLRAGTYTVVCDPHPRSMRFTVHVG